MIQDIIDSIKADPTYSIVFTFLFVLIFGFSTATSWIIKKRIGYASVMGKIEHKSGRILGLLLAVTIAAEYFDIGITLYLIIICFITWLIYLLSHTFEKLLYGNHGPRG